MSATTAARRFKILAIVDDVNSCECCGKTGLLRTVAIEDSETGDVKYFGTTCALQPIKGFGLQKKDMNYSLSRFKAAEQQMWSRVRRIYKERGGEFVNVEYDKTRLGTPLYESRFADIDLRDAIRTELGPIKAIL